MHDAMKAYHESWERELDRQFLKNDRYRKRAYICSPLSGSTAEEELSNIWRARAYMLYARTMLGYMARAPHAYLPMLLCDHVAAERALALQFGLQLLEQSEVLLICGGRISRVKSLNGQMVSSGFPRHRTHKPHVFSLPAKTEPNHLSG